MFTKTLKISCIAASVLAISFASATTNKEMDLAEVTKAANAVVMGEVLSSVTVMNGRSPETHISFSVDSELKGNTSDTITIVVPGGNYKRGKFRIGETLPGAPTLFPTQEAVFFLSSLETKDQYQIVGFNQGQLSVTEVNGEMVVSGRLTRGAKYNLTEMKEMLVEAEEL